MASYIDQYYDDLMSRMYAPKRTIASDLPEGTKLQTEPTTYIIDSAERKPIEPTFREPEKQKPEYVQNYIDNINPALKDQYNLYGDLENRRQQRESEYYSTRENLLKAAEAGAQSPEPFKSSYDYDAKIKELSDMKDMQQTPAKSPEPSMAAEIIKMVGAPLLGSMLGESGQIAQLKAQKDIEDKDKELRKEMILRQRYNQVKKANLEDEISKRMIALGQLKKGEYETYEKDRKFKQEQLKGLTETLKNIKSDDFQGLKQVEDKMQQLGIDVTKNVMQGSEKYTKFQADEARAAELMQRAKMEAKAKEKAAKGAKLLPANAIEKLSDANAAISGLHDVKSLVENNPEMFGRGIGIAGNISVATGIGDTATKAASIDSDLMAKAQRIGVYLEGGKLAEGDIKRYSKMLPQRGDKPEIVKNKIESLDRILKTKQQSDIQAYKAGGYDVGNFAIQKPAAGLTKGISGLNQDKIKVQKGKETYMIDKSDLPAALKDGFKEVK